MMHTADLLKVFAEHRGDSRCWTYSRSRRQTLIGQPDTMLDIPLGDPAMGGHSIRV